MAKKITDPNMDSTASVSDQLLNYQEETNQDDTNQDEAADDATVINAITTENENPTSLNQNNAPPIQRPQAPMQLSRLQQNPFGFRPYRNPGFNLHSIGAAGPSSRAPIRGGIPYGIPPTAPGYYYHYRNPYPMFPGPMDPSSLWGQPPRQRPICNFIYPRLTPPRQPVDGCSASSSGGTVQSPTRYQKNARVLKLLDSLQSDLASRLIMLEVAKAGNRVRNEPVTQPAGTNTDGRASRWRPKSKRLNSAVGVTDDMHQPCGRGGKLATNNIQLESRAPKVILNEVDDSGNTCNSDSTTQLENSGSLENAGDVVVGAEKAENGQQMEEDARSSKES